MRPIKTNNPTGIWRPLLLILGVMLSSEIIANDCSWEANIASMRTLPTSKDKIYQQFTRLLRAKLVTDLEEVPGNEVPDMLKMVSITDTPELGLVDPGIIETLGLYQTEPLHPRDYIQATNSLQLLIFDAIETDASKPGHISEVGVTSYAFLGPYQGNYGAHYSTIETATGAINATSAADLSRQFSISVLYAVLNRDEGACKTDARLRHLDMRVENLPDEGLTLEFRRNMKRAIQQDLSDLEANL